MWQIHSSGVKLYRREFPVFPECSVKPRAGKLSGFLNPVYVSLFRLVGLGELRPCGSRAHVNFQGKGVFISPDL